MEHWIKLEQAGYYGKVMFKAVDGSYWLQIDNVLFRGAFEACEALGLL